MEIKFFTQLRKKEEKKKKKEITNAILHDNLNWIIPTEGESK